MKSKIQYTMLAVVVLVLNAFLPKTLQAQNEIPFYKLNPNTQEIYAKADDFNVYSDSNFDYRIHKAINSLGDTIEFGRYDADSLLLGTSIHNAPSTYNTSVNSSNYMSVYKVNEVIHNFHENPAFETTMVMNSSNWEANLMQYSFENEVVAMTGFVSQSFYSRQSVLTFRHANGDLMQEYILDASQLIFFSNPQHLGDSLISFNLWYNNSAQFEIYDSAVVNRVTGAVQGFGAIDKSLFPTQPSGAPEGRVSVTMNYLTNEVVNVMDASQQTTNFRELVALPSDFGQAVVYNQAYSFDVKWINSDGTQVSTFTVDSSLYQYPTGSQCPENFTAFQIDQNRAGVFFKKNGANLLILDKTTNQITHMYQDIQGVNGGSNAACMYKDGYLNVFHAGQIGVHVDVFDISNNSFEYIRHYKSRVMSQSYPGFYENIADVGDYVFSIVGNSIYFSWHLKTIADFSVKIGNNDILNLFDQRISSISFSLDIPSNPYFTEQGYTLDVSSVGLVDSVSFRYKEILVYDEYTKLSNIVFGDSVTKVEIEAFVSGDWADTNLSVLTDSVNAGKYKFLLTNQEISNFKPGDVEEDFIIKLTYLDSDNDGISDPTEGYVLMGSSLDTDNDSIPDYLDTDSDNDSIPDSVEGILDTDNDSIPNYLDTDSDNDSIPDKIEGAADLDNDSTPNYLDLDSDGDGYSDKEEYYSTEFDFLNKDEDADGIPNESHTEDEDNDGIVDALDPINNISVANLEYKNLKVWTNENLLFVANKENVSVNIYDVMGRLITKSANKTKHQFNLKSGVYTLSIKSETFGLSTSKKVVIQ